jgi:hypothetical protein
MKTYFSFLLKPHLLFMSVVRGFAVYHFVLLIDVDNAARTKYYLLLFGGSHHSC